MSRDGINFQVATPADDADLRTLLRANPMGGWVSVAMEREPRYFAELIDGDEHQAIIARDAITGEAVGMCARTVRPAYIDGLRQPLGYIGELRIAPCYRHRIRIIRAGFELLQRELHEPERTPYYLTAIVTDNEPARRLLEADIPGKPTYRPVGDGSSLVLRTGHRRAPLLAANDDDIPGIAACLARNHSRYQFAPAWSEAALRHAARDGGPAAKDFLVHRSNGRIFGCLALWDQTKIKQAVVHGYHPRIARLRHLLNLLGPITGLPRLPAAGTPLRQIYLSLAAIDDDDPDVLINLVAAGLAEASRRGFDSVVISMAATNPMLPALRRAFRARDYRSRLYLAHWPDATPRIADLSRLPLHVEAALL